MRRGFVAGHVGNRGEKATAAADRDANRSGRAPADEEGHIVSAEGRAIRLQGVALNREAVPAGLIKTIAIFFWQ